MLPEPVQSYLPLVLIVAGGAVLLWNQKGRITALLARLRPAAKAEPVLTPAERFDRFCALRQWCEATGQAEAVKALDSVILPAIVQGGPKA